MLDRRNLLMGGAALAASACAPSSNVPAAPKKLIAVTMDDFDVGGNFYITPEVRHTNILAALAAHNHKAAAFVTGKNVDNDFGRRVLKDWAEAGHMLANHTWSHRNSSDEDTESIKADILKNHIFLSDFEGYEKVFRFPFLAEGGTPEKEMDYRAFLLAQGFANAPVTIDSLDWFITSRLEARLRDVPNFDTTKYRDYYVSFVREVSEQKHQLALRLGFEGLPHTLLVHHNILNGLFLRDVMDALSEDGWRFVDAKAVLTHSLYSLKPKTPNNGRSVLSVLAQEQDIALDYPKKYDGFGKEYMESLGL